MSKIIVDQIELKNFFSYGNQWQTVDFREGVNMVLGYDKDKERSNGAGKTSFLEAIPFALFGQTSKGVNQNKIINWKNGKACEVRLHFRKDGVPYIIHRGIKPGKLDLIRDGVEIPKLADKRVFQMELEQDLIGMDFKAAETLLFQNTNNMISLFNTPKADKRKFIERFANIGIYSEMNELTNNKLTNIGKRLDEIEMEVRFKSRSIQDIEEKMARMVLPDIDSFKSGLDEAKQELSDWNDEHDDDPTIIQNVQEDIDENMQKRSEIVDQCVSASNEVKAIEDEITVLSTEKKSSEKRKDEIGDLTEQKEKLERVREALSKFENLDRTDLTKDITELNDKKGKEKELLAECKVYIQQYKNEIAELENKDVTDESVCPTCFQDVDHEHIRQYTENRIDGLKRELTAQGGQVSNIEDQISEIDRKLEQKGKELADIDNKILKKGKLEQALARLEGVTEKEEELNRINDRIKEIDDRLEELDGKHANSVSIVKDFELRRDEIDSIITEKRELLEKFKDIERERKSLEEKVRLKEESYESQKKIYDERIAENETNAATKTQLQSEIANFDVERKKLEKMKDYLSYVKESLKDENVKQYAISNIVPYIQQQTNHYLAETGHNYYLELDNWLEGTIKGYGVGDCSFGNMSGGEGKSIDTALKFAMMDVARKQAGSYMDVLVLDEFLDSSIDSHGIEKTFEIIKLKQREDNLKVFIVSHREEVADFDVDNVYRVTKEDGFSTIGLV